MVHLVLLFGTLSRGTIGSSLPPSALWEVLLLGGQRLLQLSFLEEALGRLLVDN